MRLGKRCWYPRAMPANEKPPARLVDNYYFAENYSKIPLF